MLGSPAARTEPYQFDPRGVLGQPPAAFAIYPLIYSAGPDKCYGVVSEGGQFISQYINPFYSVTASGYADGPVGNTKDISGESGTSGWYAGMNSWVDNIHNQLIGTR